MILLVALCGEKLHLPDAKKCTFGGYGVIFPSACCGEKVHSPVESLDFACLLACCLLLNADAKKCTFRWKAMIFFVRVAAKKSTFIGEFGGEKAHSPKERCDFVESCCG